MFRSTRQTVVLLISLAWITFFVWGPLVGLAFVFDRWILEESFNRIGWAMLIGGAWIAYIFAVVPFPFFPGSVRSFKTLFVFLVFAAVAGWFGGPLIVTGLNCTSSVKPEKIIVEQLESKGKILRFKNNTGDRAGMTFKSSTASWKESKGKTREALLYKGRLGIYWCTFAD
jgi:hypothetical protein